MHLYLDKYNKLSKQQIAEVIINSIQKTAQALVGVYEIKTKVCFHKMRGVLEDKIFILEYL